jgi:hypothetical protein
VLLGRSDTEYAVYTQRIRHEETRTSVFPCL